MSDGDGCFMALLVAGLAVILLMGSCGAGMERMRAEFRTCRLLLQTADSATVLKTKPECQRWTLPVKTEKP